MSEDAEREAYRRGARAAAMEMKQRGTSALMEMRRRTNPRTFAAEKRHDCSPRSLITRFRGMAAAGKYLLQEMERGEWPKGGDDVRSLEREAKVERLEARVAELEAALNRIRDKLAMRARPLPLGLASIEQIAAAALKGGDAE